MNINLSLLGQMITFAIFVFVTMKYVWPPVMKALEDRRSKIAEGLEAAERGKHDFEIARKKIAGELKEAHRKAAEIEEAANHKANEIVQKSKEDARIEGDRMIRLAKDQISQEYASAKKDLMKELSQYTIKGLETLLDQGVDKSVNIRLIDQIISDIAEA